MSAPDTPVTTNCLNCGHALAGHYCSQCGQAAEVHVPTSMELVHEVLEGITHSDSRLWRTLTTLWFRPGMLTLEFIRGRRMAYLPPFRLYLVMSVIFFIIASGSDSNLKFISAADLRANHMDTSHGKPLAEADCGDFQFGDPASAFNQRLKHGCLVSVKDSGRSLQHQALAMLPKAMFVFLPLLALLHKLLYWRPRHRYVEHLLFFLHLHAFFFSMAILLALLGRLDGVAMLASAAGVLATLLNLVLVVYTALALRRVFAQGWTLTLVKGVLLFFLYAVLLALTVSAVFFYSFMAL